MYVLLKGELSMTPDEPDEAALPPEPRWPAIVACLAVGGLYLSLPPTIAVGPRWLPLLIISLFIIPSVITHRTGNHAANRVLGHVLSGVLTVYMLWSLVLLIKALPAHKEPPVLLMRSAAALWATNVLVFASWYWRLDAGGPYGRDQRAGHTTGAFLFPQMTLPPKKVPSDQRPWSPLFVDYLFLAFNTSTAFSPTDTPILSRWAKVLVMIQSVISLAVVALLAARAVNIL